MNEDLYVTHSCTSVIKTSKVFTDHLSYYVSVGVPSYIQFKFTLFKRRGRRLSPGLLGCSIICLNSPAGLSSVSKLDEVLMSADCLSSLGGSELSRESQAITCEG